MLISICCFIASFTPLRNTEGVPFACFHPFWEGKRCPGRCEAKWANPYELVMCDSSLVKMTLWIISHSPTFSFTQKCPRMSCDFSGTQNHPYSFLTTKEVYREALFFHQSHSSMFVRQRFPTKTHWQHQPSYASWYPLSEQTASASLSVKWR